MARREGKHILEMVERYTLPPYDYLTDDMTVPFAIELVEKDREISDLKLVVQHGNDVVHAAEAEIERLRDRAERAEASAENEVIINRDMLAAIMWALGEVPDVHGQWFGEHEPEIPEGKRPKPYWWRTHLRGMAGIDQQSAPEKS